MLKAKRLLYSEAARRQKETTMKEAYCISSDMIGEIISTLFPDHEGGTREYIEEVFESRGWNVSYGTDIKRRKPLRQLARLIAGYPRHPLTAHVLAVVHFAHRWCENTSHLTVSPITGKCQNGKAPDGVQYPRISMEFVEVGHKDNVPNEWKAPLVSQDVAKAAEEEDG